MSTSSSTSTTTIEVKQKGCKAKLKRWVKKLKIEVYALYLAHSSNEMPFWRKCCVFIIICYILSPIDLIPDFIPIFGLLDDLILAPLLIALAIKLVPKELMQKCREQSKEDQKNGKIKLPKSKIGLCIVISIWIILFVGSIMIALYVPGLPTTFKNNKKHKKD